MKRHLIDILIIFSLFLITCKGEKAASIENNNFIIADMIRIDDYHNNIYIEIDDYLFCLSILESENNKTFNLQVKDPKNPLLFNGTDLYWLRAEFINGDKINTEILLNNKGYYSEYIISEDDMKHIKIE